MYVCFEPNFYSQIWLLRCFFNISRTISILAVIIFGQESAYIQLDLRILFYILAESLSRFTLPILPPL